MKADAALEAHLAVAARNTNAVVLRLLHLTCFLHQTNRLRHLQSCHVGKGCREWSQADVRLAAKPNCVAGKSAV